MNVPLKLSWDLLEELCCKTSPNVAQDIWLTLAEKLDFALDSITTSQTEKKVSLRTTIQSSSVL